MRLLLLCTLVLSTAPATAGDGGFRCGGKLISVGDSRLDLLGRCGWPSVEEHAQEERARLWRDRKQHSAVGERRTIAIDRWTYDFGPSQFVQTVTLQGGVIVDIKAGRHGTAEGAAAREPPAVRRARCLADSLAEDELTGPLLLRCGEPTLREAWDETFTVAVPAGRGHEVEAEHSEHYEVWVYDFGPQAFVRYLDIEGGRVVHIHSGTYGYSSP
jgi:hypothetical protein